MKYKIHIGDALTILKSMKDKSINCCVTSPPYWGLRDYGVDGQLGLEKTPEEYIAKMVEIFREVRRVLRDDGTLWLNLGDTYAREGGKTSGVSRHWDGRESDPGGLHDKRSLASEIGIKPKDLVGIPWIVAFALRADGWYLRQDIIWNKPNPMPESVTDRCTKAHEYIFLFSKSKRYYYDYEAIKDPTSNNPISAARRKRADFGSVGTSALHETEFGQSGRGVNARYKGDIRNKRSVWTVSTKPFKGAHFATFPPDLIEPCILAGCPEDGTVLDPFAGSGTVGEVSLKHFRKFIGIELNAQYVNEIAIPRLQSECIRFKQERLFK